MTPHPIDHIIVKEPASAQNLTVFPLHLSQTTGPDYLPLSTAIEQHGLVVKEIGTVSEGERGRGCGVLNRILPESLRAFADEASSTLANFMYCPSAVPIR